MGLLRNREELQSGADELLRVYLDAKTQNAEDVLNELFSKYAEPLIQEIVASRLRGRFKGDRQDLQNDIVLLVLSRLRAVRGSPEAIQIRHFRDYVAVLAYNACRHYYREKYPLRRLFKNRLRYVLSHDSHLAIWRNQEELICGKKEWIGRMDICSREVLDNSGGVFLEHEDTRKQLNRLFEKISQPVRLEDLLEPFADSWQPGDIDEETVHSPRPNQEASLSSRTELERTWREIINLPLKQRIALLLSLRDEQGDAILLVFPATGVASARKIAETLEMRAHALAALWKDLPLGDLKIAEIIGVTRQQVINLRKCARERIARRIFGAR